MGERQQQQFQISLGIVFGAPGQAGDHAGRFVGDNGQEVIDRFAVGLAPQRGESFALDLAPEQRADARAGESEAQVVDEIRRQHEGIAERMADLGRIDVGPLGRRAGSRFLFQYSNTTREDACFMDATCSVARRRRRSLSPTGTLAPAFRRDVTGGAGAVPGTPWTAGQCGLVLRPQSNWPRSDVCLGSPQSTWARRLRQAPACGAAT